MYLIPDSQRISPLSGGLTLEMSPQVILCLGMEKFSKLPRGMWLSLSDAGNKRFRIVDPWRSSFGPFGGLNLSKHSCYQSAMPHAGEANQY